MEFSCPNSKHAGENWKIETWRILSIQSRTAHGKLGEPRGREGASARRTSSECPTSRLLGLPPARRVTCHRDHASCLPPGVLRHAPSSAVTEPTRSSPSIWPIEWNFRFSGSEDPNRLHNPLRHINFGQQRCLLRDACQEYTLSLAKGGQVQCTMRGEAPSPGARAPKWPSLCCMPCPW